MVKAIIISAVLGVLTALGIGGGSLLLLYLTTFAAFSPAEARGISLLFFFPAACFSYFKKGHHVPFKKLLPAIFSGCLTAAVFSFAARKIDPHFFEKALGLLFLFLGLRELFYKPRQ